MLRRWRECLDPASMIPDELAQCFTRAVRARGEAYLTAGRIILVRPEPLLFRTVAKGSAMWNVTLDARGGGKLAMSCTCPFAEDRGFCRHLWATLRLADEQRALKPLLDSTGGLFVDSSGSGDGDHDHLLAPDVSRKLPFSGALIDSVRGEPRARKPYPPAALPAWRQLIDSVRLSARYEQPAASKAEWPDDRRLMYLVDLGASASSAGLVVELATEKREPDGTWSLPKLFRTGAESWMAVPDPIDRQIGQMLRGSRRITDWVGSDSLTGFVLTPNTFDTVLRLMSDTGRLRIRRDSHDRPTETARWDDSAPWQIRYRVERRGHGTVALVASLHRGDESMSFDRPAFIHRAGFLVCDDTIARLEVEGPFALAAQLRESGSVTLGETELPALIGELADLPAAPQIILPEGLSVHEASPPPQPVLTLSRFDDRWHHNQFSAGLSFDYDGVLVGGARPGVTVFDPRRNRIIRRDRSAEAEARVLVESQGLRRERDSSTGLTMLTVPSSRFEPLVRALTAAGWTVLVEGIEHRISTDMRASVRSGVDWFDLDVAVAFGNTEVPLPRILDALRAKESSVELGDGVVGLITDELKQRLTPILAVAGGNRLRFRRSQTALLDALLATVPAVDADKQFERARGELQHFNRVEAVSEPTTFRGALRPYQREALGWFHFLRRFGLGGCLADDMGLGKTVQVLALLEGRRLEKAGPSLVVVPRSLVFNWRQEAERFTPELRVLDHTGVGRDRSSIQLHDENLVITTYGTLRQDITALREIEFDYVILDEAQAIKNATTAVAKAARLLRGRQRLALTGTPIENRVDELWSLFEFLNPGMLGTARSFKALARVRSIGLEQPAPAPNDSAEVALLARVLRPVILRRTKERVAPELPPRVEQTLMVELERPQRRVYDELLAHYRQSLLPYIERMGMARSRLKVLEALLRLRQAACHPALISRASTDAGSAKLDVLIPKLVEAKSESHKSLVFSQFTSFLALLRERLDAEGMSYAYLDGQTHDRETVVERFQRDPDCPLFLISLRAGGHGLNLTAAEYVFLLDPWWNPAVEAQAIDRAHRIGQQRHVIATRLVARDTVEEKILELQQSKRDLADAILGEDRGALAEIGREELELLLS